MKKLLCLAIMLFVLSGIAMADTYSDTVWILCQPDSYVNIRNNPFGKSDVVGRADCGDDFSTDGKTKNVFLHVYATTETGEGWISKGYVVYDKPVSIGRKMVIESRGRVNARKTVNGKRRCWVKSGDVVTVYWMAEWAVTSKGFIKSEYLGEYE